MVGAIALVDGELVVRVAAVVTSLPARAGGGGGSSGGAAGGVAGAAGAAVISIGGGYAARHPRAGRALNRASRFFIIFGVAILALVFFPLFLPFLLLHRALGLGRRAQPLGAPLEGGAPFPRRVGPDLVAGLAALRARDADLDETGVAALVTRLALASVEARSTLTMSAVEPYLGDALRAELERRARILRRRRRHDTYANPFVIHAGVVGARTTDVWESLVVAVEMEYVTVSTRRRRGTAEPERRRHDELWLLQRRAGSVSHTRAVAAGRCPNCQSPLQVDPTGRCGYCHSILASDPGGWTVTAFVGPPAPWGGNPGEQSGGNLFLASLLFLYGTVTVLVGLRAALAIQNDLLDRSAYSASPVCAADAPVAADCRRTVAVTVTTVGSASTDTARAPDAMAERDVTLSTPSGPMTIRLVGGADATAVPRTGTTASLVVWEGDPTALFFPTIETVTSDGPGGETTTTQPGPSVLEDTTLNPSAVVDAAIPRVVLAGSGALALLLGGLLVLVSLVQRHRRTL